MLGVSAQRNCGATQSHSELLIVLDADTLPASDFVRSAATAFDRIHFSAACPWFAPANWRPEIHTVYGVLNVGVFNPRAGIYRIVYLHRHRSRQQADGM